MYRLFIANKNYSSWSLRPWVLMRALPIPFDEQLQQFADGSNWQAFRRFSPNGRVPCLHDGSTVVWDSLAIVEYLADQALSKARSGFDWQASEGDLEEAFFALIAAELRQLKPLRKFITPLLETSLSPLSVSRRSDATGALRAEHLETVAGLARQYGFAECSPIALQVYWTLYIGVLAFWAADKSPKQEDTLALLDQSLTMFVAWLRSEHGKTLS